jgi:uncharacterized short protein YbdD (DUF466 family)
MPLREAWNLAARTARLMVGVPDYDAYAAHRATHHPGDPAMTRAEFHRNRIANRYGGDPSKAGRCC